MILKNIFYIKNLIHICKEQRLARSEAAWILGLGVVGQDQSTGTASVTVFGG